MLQSLIEQTRARILSASDAVCLERARLVTAAYQRYAGDPAPVRRAKTLDHILNHMTLDVETNPVFAGNTSTSPRAWMLLPEYGFQFPIQAIVENPHLEGFLGGDVIPNDMRAFWKDRSLGYGCDIGHLTVDNSLLVKRGLTALIVEAEQACEEIDPERAIVVRIKIRGDFRIRPPAVYSRAPSGM